MQGQSRLRCARLETFAHAQAGDRSQRIRTYNFPENRVTDHRIGLTLYKLDQIVAGQLDPVTEALIEYDRDQLRGDMDD